MIRTIVGKYMKEREELLYLWFSGGIMIEVSELKDSTGREGREKRELFSVQVGLKKGCGMSS